LITPGCLFRKFHSSPPVNCFDFVLHGQPCFVLYLIFVSFRTPQVVVMRKHVFLLARANGVRPNILSAQVATESRLPPSKQALAAFSNVVLPALKTDMNVWNSATLGDAWRQIDVTLRTSEPHNREVVLQHDLVALSRCTGEAEVDHLLGTFPSQIRDAIRAHSHFSTETVEEVYAHLGQEIEVRGYGWQFSVQAPTSKDIEHIIQRIGKFADDGRGNISSTLHRVSCWRGRRGEILGVTMRVGRFAPNCAASLLPLAMKGNLLLLSRPGAGKTTMLRDLAASLGRHVSFPRVVVVDTSNEIGGDGIVPHPFLGRARRIQVPRRAEQLRVLVEVLQNHSPEYVIIDEIGTAAEAEAAWSMSQRGIKLVATCHGENLAQLLQNRELNTLVGGVSQAFLSNEERRLRNKIKKSILERPHSSPFHSVVELVRRNVGFVYRDVNQAVDLILNEQDPAKNTSICGEVNLLEPLPDFLVSDEPHPSPDTNDNVVPPSLDSDGYLVEHGNSRDHQNNESFGRNQSYHSQSRYPPRRHASVKKNILKELDQLL
jgi:stage III sporulation protein SpoIIIAA